MILNWMCKNNCITLLKVKSQAKQIQVIQSKDLWLQKFQLTASETWFKSSQQTVCEHSLRHGLARFTRLDWAYGLATLATVWPFLPWWKPWTVRPCGLVLFWPKSSTARRIIGPFFLFISIVCRRFCYTPGYKKT